MSVDPKELAILVSLALLAGVSILAMVAVARDLKAILRGINVLRVQQANMIRMLLGAGFKLRGTRSWNDDRLQTRVSAELDLTDFDWKIPFDD